MGYLTKVGRHSQHTLGLLLCKKNQLIWLLGEKCNSNRMNSSWKEKYTMPLPLMANVETWGLMIQEKTGQEESWGAVFSSASGSYCGHPL